MAASWLLLRELDPSREHELDADAQEQERDDPHHHERADFAEPVEQRRRVPEGHVKHERRQGSAHHRHRHARREQRRRPWELCPQRNRGGDRSGPGRQGKRDRKEAATDDLGFREHLRFVGGLLRTSSWSLLFSICQPVAATSRPPPTRTTGSERPNRASTCVPSTMDATMTTQELMATWRASRWTTA